MLFWLAEAAGVPDDLLERGTKAVVQHMSSDGGTQCAALRRVIPWAEILAALEA